MAPERLACRLRHGGRRHRQRGLTLVELMVSIAISLFMIAGLVTLYVNNSTARTELDRSSRQIENGRFAIDMLRDDIALAGYYGEIAPRDVAAFGVANPCTTTAADMGWSTNAAPTPSRAPVAVQGPETSNTIPAAWACTGISQRAGTGFLAVRRVQPVAIAATAALAGTQYVQSSGCLDGTRPFVLASGAGAANFPLTGPDCATVRPVREYLSRLYYISTCGVCSPSDGVPTLKVRELQGSAIVERTVADGIEDLQFEFGIDDNVVAPGVVGDGIVERFVALGTAAEWPNVVAVRVRLISRATTATPGHVDDKTYDRGALFAAYTPASGEVQFKRRAYTALVGLPNIAGPREAP
jgi:type IV pilus assembly protein PilW